jgi:hypothetical protein
LEQAWRRAKAAEDEVKIVQRQLECMRETIGPSATPSNIKHILEDNERLKETLKVFEKQVCRFLGNYQPLKHICFCVPLPNPFAPSFHIGLQREHKHGLTLLIWAWRGFETF